ncbi:hypothetical protein C2G38_2230533 [Gigaspora rosea]|uniref:Protein kinase domain-containing protein n=1 Tax=Gigaspora rosea TaxID=44941 RepID=A0A397TYN1_9GLOM|nr:hypothetical protein C2G38_2230533 [Gigaspora rosea]
MYQVGYCYILGIGVEIDKPKAFTSYLKSAEEADAKYKSKYGKYAHCDEDNTLPAWGQSCDPDIATRLSEIKKLGKGGLGSVYQQPCWMYRCTQDVGSSMENNNDFLKEDCLEKDENVLEENIYGVMPYVAPEVLSGEQQFTKAADIYGQGLQRIATKVVLETPKCYIVLAKKCMDSNPQKRPSAWDVDKTIDVWLDEIANSDDNKIKRQFLDADKKAIKLLPTSKHPDEIYTSKIIGTKLISKAIKGIYLFLDESICNSLLHIYL